MIEKILWIVLFIVIILRGRADRPERDSCRCGCE
jgi:hypothetical protein